ncbi:hypothetical protein [Vreelandella sp. V005]
MIHIRAIRWLGRHPKVGNVILGLVAIVLLFGIGRFLYMAVSNDQLS